MKKLAIAVGILLVLLIATVVVVPIVLKEPITNAVKKEANANLNATINFTDVNISLLRSFPDVYVGVEQLSVTGKGAFEDRTLVYLNALSLDVNLMSAFSGKPIINEIALNGGFANVVVLEDGTANYDIVPETDAAQDSTPQTQSDGAFAVQLKRFVVDGLEVMYTDQQSGTTFSTAGINMTLKGDFASDRTTLATRLLLQEVKLAMGSVAYLSGAELELTADVDADLANKNYTLHKNEFRINGLHLMLDGSVAMPNQEDLTIDLTYAAAKTEFKEILSLVPAIYANDFDDVQASGSLALSGMVHGTYSENEIPAFTANVKVENGQFKYPDLPKSVDGIAIDVAVTNPGGDIDNTVIDLKKFKFQLAENPFEVRANIKTPVSDPDIDASFKGKIDLNSLADAIPMEQGDQLSGTIIADAEMKGKQSDLDRGRYNKFNATGEFILMDINYASESVAVPIEVTYAQFKFAPRYLELASFDAKAGKTDVKLKGKITNYLGYILGDGTLKGDFALNSTLIEGNELAGLSASEEEAPSEVQKETTPKQAEQANEPIVIPQDIDVTLATNITKLVYDNINLLNTKGKVIVRNGKADLRGLSFNTLGGAVAMNGYYDTGSGKNAKLNYDLTVDNIVLKEAYSTFGSIQKLAPIAEKTEGRVSATFNVLGSMQNGTEVEYSSLNGGGRLTSPSLKITGTEALNKIAQVVKINAFKNPEVKDVNLSFKFVDGRVHVSPFDVKIGPVAATIFGSHGFDETMDYVLATEVPTSALGSQANAVIGGLISQANKLGANFSAGEKVKVDILVKGTFAKPQITPSFGGSSGGGTTTENLKAAAEAELNKAKEEAERRAKEEAEKLRKEAEERARKEAERLKKKAEDEAKKQAEDALKGLFGKPK